ncbi:MAG: adenylate/guanylate cyclase domain-containing protein [Rhizomicrobium sp.]|nr:adenylate/guanylate cyclase domain-containing protein [Rhizomicrobium sp.]
MTLKDVRSVFLAKHCPNPPLLEAAIDRVGVWGVRDLAPGTYLCRAGDRAEACWLIVSGQVEIEEEGMSVTFRVAGDLIGEQAFITTLLDKESGLRTADMIARGGVKVVCFDASLQERFTDEERAVWALTLASVVNKKLEQATHQRAELRHTLTDRSALLNRFSEGDALGIVLKAVEDESAPVAIREIIVWFSDIANFSTWATQQEPDVVADLARKLTGCQMDCIRHAEGHIDKLLGDGVMAVWFIDTNERRDRLPRLAVECARTALAKVEEILQAEGLDDALGIRIGLHAGTACFGDFGAKERIAVTVLGHDVNLASRYEQAKHDSLPAVRVSPALKALVEAGTPTSGWSFGPAATVTVKHGVEIEVFSPNPLMPERTPT